MDTALITVDAIVFVGFIVAVVAVGIGMSRHESDSEGYFLAGRGLTWYLIGFSLIAANISTEQFVGMSGQAANYLGLAIASYEWMAAITLVVVAFFVLPAFLRAGIYTIPEFLEYRFNHQSRTLMSVLMMITYICVTLPAVIYSGAKTADVLFAGTTIAGVPINVTTASWIIGFMAAVYVVAGGLKACAWADLLQGSALILGGAVIMFLAFRALGRAPAETVGLAADAAQAGPVGRFLALNGEKLHMVLPRTDAFVPWTALVLGLWIPNFYYWGLNQYIMQRALGSRSVGEGQKGVVFAAALKLLIPFIVVFPGIIAFNLFKDDMKADAATTTNKDALARFEAGKAAPERARSVFPFNADFAALHPETAKEILQFNRRAAGVAAPEAASTAEANDRLIEAVTAKNQTLPPGERVEIEKQLIGYQYDSAFGLLIKKLVPPGLKGFILAAILGAVTSTLAAMLNAASTIFTMDIYKQYLKKDASQGNLVTMGRVTVAVFVAVGCLIAPLLDDPRFGGIFTYIQEFQGFISPGILGVFIFGLFVKRAPRGCGVVGLVLSPVIYGLLKLVLPELAFLDRMAITFGAVLAALAAMSLARPLAEPIELPQQTKIDAQTSRTAQWAGAAVVVATLVLYAIFW
jgi:SSS family solute:Na+ symporter